MIELKIMKRLMGIVPLLNAINIGIIPEKCQGKIDLDLYVSLLKRYCRSGTNLIDCLSCGGMLKSVS